MGLHIAAGLNHWVKSAQARALHAGRLNIGPRLILGFVFIILSMLAADAVVLWQFQVVRTQATRLHDIDQKLVAILRVHSSLLAFQDRLNALAASEDADRLVTEAGPLRTAVLEDIGRATAAFSLQPFDLQQDPTILPTLQVIQSAVPSQLEAINTLATSGDWRAVHLRLENQIRPLESLTSALVDKVAREAGEEQTQTVLNIKRVQRLVFLVVPLTAVFTLLIAATLGLVITRSITQPLARLVEGSKALARGEFQHQVAISGEDELAHLGRVFNDSARRLRDLYATLQSSEDRLRRVIDTIPAHAWSTLPDGSVDFINQRFLEFTGRSREDLLGWGWGSVVHNDDLTNYVDRWHAAVSAGEPLESEARVRRADGDYRWLLIRNVPLRDESGNIVNWYGTAIDIEERHRAEDALRRSEAYLHDAQRAGHTGSWRHEVLSGVVTISPEARRIWGLNPDEDASVTEFFFGRIHPEHRPVVEQEYRAAQLKKAEFQSDFRIVLPDGAVKNIHSVGHPILNQSGEIVEFVGAVMDVTERKRAEEELRQAQADLAHASRVTTMGELVASIAHEVNQPLGAIVTNGSACLRLLSRDTLDLDKTREIIGRMIKDGMRASEVIKRVRELLHKAPSERTPLNINEAVQEVIDLVNSDLRRSKVELLIELAGDLPPVVGDRIQLQQVILNMILNAKDAMSEVHTHPRELLITTLKNESSGVVVAVQDSGKGLDPKDAESIFDPFFTTKADGMGLGLSISQRIIEDHGGRMWATPNEPQGAVFQFTLPTENDGV
jgi:PAS domain S-box-containing protein